MASATVPDLAVSEHAAPAYEEKVSDDKYTDEKASPTSEHASQLDGHFDPQDGLGDTVFVKGEPVIVDGRDVSRYVVDLRDDGDPPLTFRSFVLGTIFGALGAALYQIFEFKPAGAGISGVFLQLVIWTFGRAWELVVPTGARIRGTRLGALAPILDFINPGTFRIKEVRFVRSLPQRTAHPAPACGGYCRRNDGIIWKLLGFELCCTTSKSFDSKIWKMCLIVFQALLRCSRPRHHRHPCDVLYCGFWIFHSRPPTPSHGISGGDGLLGQPPYRYCIPEYASCYGRPCSLAA
jgi:hypothetical protein